MFNSNTRKVRKVVLDQETFEFDVVLSNNMLQYYSFGKSIELFLLKSCTKELVKTASSICIY